MRNSTLSRLALLGLASVSSVAFAASSMNGQIRFDGRFTLNHEKAGGGNVDSTYESNDQLHISRARLDFAGDVAKDWTYNIRLEKSEHENDQIGLGTDVFPAAHLPTLERATALTSVDAMIARAYVCWSGVEGINVKMGRIGTPEVTSDRLYYKPYIGKYPNDRAVGSVTNYSGDHAGFAVDGLAGPVGYSFGVWKQTDLRKLSIDAAEMAAIINDPTTFDLFAANLDTAVSPTHYDSKSLRLGFGGRLSFAQEMKSGTSFGVGIGYNQAPLNVAVLASTLVSPYNGTGPVQEVTGSATFKDLSNLAIDASAVYKLFQVNAGYQYQEMKTDITFPAPVANTATADILNQKGSATAYWLEVGYLVMGDSYKFCTKNAVISGVKLREKQAGFEVTGRYGVETRKNMLALLSNVGWSDFNTAADGTTAAVRAQVNVVQDAAKLQDAAITVAVDNQAPAGNQISGADASFLETKMTGFSIALNYYMAENAVLKLEYEGRHNEFKRGNLQTDWKDSAFNKNVGTLRLRADYSF